MAAKTATILIRLTPEDRARLQRVAETEFLEAATWARQAVLRVLQQAEGARPPAETPISPTRQDRKSGRKR
jgi:hypothetical protein